MIFPVTDECIQPLGISDYRIRDDQMNEHTAFDNDFELFGAHRARLNLTDWPPGYRGNFEPMESGTYPWLEIDLDQRTVITGIATQGYGDDTAREWVTRYLMSYQKGNDLIFFKEASGVSPKVSVTLSISWSIFTWIASFFSVRKNR